MRRNAQRAAARARWLAACAAVAATSLGSAVAPAMPPSRLLDAFDDIGAWRGSASAGVSASVHPDAGRQGGGLRLDFDFGQVAGYATAERDLPLELPANFEISFYVRGNAPPNNLEFKLVDASGDNVWWVNRREFRFPQDWEPVRIKRRHIEFAWGPTTDRSLRRSARIQIVVSAGSGGGKGSLWIDELRIRELPVDDGKVPPPEASASSSAPGSAAADALDGDPATAWRSAPRRARETMTLDLRRPREFGGLVLHWLAGAHARRYEVEFSDDGRDWRSVRAVREGNGGSDFLWLPDSGTRFVRLVMRDGPGPAYGLAEIEVKDIDFGASANAFVSHLARAAPRGHYPRAFVGEQNYWTVVGVDGGASEGLLSEDGALEVGKGAFSIEPFLVTPGGLLTWADVTIGHSLQDGYLPIPAVTWDHAALRLGISVFATGSAERSWLVARYEIRNKLDTPQPLELALALRPFQVNPPSQWLNLQGGVSPVHDIAWDGTAVSVDGRRRVFPLQAPDVFSGGALDGGGAAEILLAHPLPPRTGIHDASGFTSGVLVYRGELGPGAARTIDLVVPLDGPDEPPAAPALDPADWYQRERERVADAWREKLNRISISLPAQGTELANSLRTALAHVLINRDGAALQPGSRSYERSWIRDGAMTSEALLRLGHEDVVRDFVRWYAPHQFPDGAVPCCVDRRGADPVPEHDSHGELNFAIAELYRYTRDRGELAALWPHVQRSIRYMDSLRTAERLETAGDERQPFYGLLAPSISHEGYSAKPVHSYWDDFWALRGYKDALEMAQVQGLVGEAESLVHSLAEFRTDLHASLAATIARHGIDYLPGSAELGDFDATSTTIALDPAGELDALPRPQLTATFERYWRDHLGRRDRTTAWDAYTPYEWRIVGAYLRLGWIERAHALIDFHMAMRRPSEWNQWAEVVSRNLREPRFIGDMPHGWVASDFIRSALDLFAYVRARDSALVVAGGVRPEWLEGDGIRVRNLGTPFGRLSYTLARRDGRCVLKLSALAEIPAGGIVVPEAACPSRGRATVDGRPVPWTDGELRLGRLPATVVMQD